MIGDFNMEILKGRDYCYTFICPCYNIETEIKRDLPVGDKC